MPEVSPSKENRERRARWLQRKEAVEFGRAPVHTGFLLPSTVVTTLLSLPISRTVFFFFSFNADSLTHAYNVKISNSKNTVCSPEDPPSRGQRSQHSCTAIQAEVLLLLSF